MLFATDVPYGNHLSALTLIAAVLEQIGASEAIRRAIMGETLEGILRGELPTLTAPLAPPVVELSPVNLRLAGYLSVVDPAALAAPARRHRHARPRRRRVRGRPGSWSRCDELIAAARELWEATPLDGNGGWGPGFGSLRDALRLSCSSRTSSP